MTLEPVPLVSMISSASYRPSGSDYYFESTLASGFLTPLISNNSPRDSVASSQSFCYRGFASEHSLPETSICDTGSPGANEFLRATACGISPGWHQKSDDLPIPTVRQDLDGQHDQWILGGGILFENQGIVLAPEELCLALHDYGSAAGMGSIAYSSTESTWDIISSIAQQGRSFYSQSDQIERFSPKREESAMMKMEEDIDEFSARLCNRVTVSATKGKGVKGGHRAAGATKKPSKNASITTMGMLGGILIEYSVDPHERDPTTGKCFRPGRQIVKAHHCLHRGGDGRLCTRRFRRIEHLRRHEQVHSGRKDFGCVVCFREFNRNDNRQAHYDTHLRKEGKKDVRNVKMSLRELEIVLSEQDPINCRRVIQKLRLKHGL